MSEEKKSLLYLLARRFCEGDDSAFNEFCRLFEGVTQNSEQSKIRSMLKRTAAGQAWAKNRETLEDLYQETCLTMYKKLPDFIKETEEGLKTGKYAHDDFEKRFYGYVEGIARNTILQHTSRGKFYSKDFPRNTRPCAWAALQENAEGETEDRDETYQSPSVRRPHSAAVNVENIPDDADHDLLKRAEYDATLSGIKDIATSEEITLIDFMKQGYSNKEIGGMMGYSEPQISKKIKALRIKITGHFPPPGK